MTSAGLRLMHLAAAEELVRGWKMKSLGPVRQLVQGGTVGLLVLAACGGSSPPLQPVDAGGVDISPQDQEALSSSFSNLSAQLAASGRPNDAAAVTVAALAIGSGSKATSSTLTTGAALRASSAAVRTGDTAAQTQHYGPIPAETLGVEVTLNHFPGNPATQRFAGIINWTTGAQQVVLVYSPLAAGSFGGALPTATGIIDIPPVVPAPASPPPAGVWSADAGTESSRVVSSGAPCSVVPTGVTSCTQATFTGGFDITDSAPDGTIPDNPAQGTQTASLPVGPMNGVQLTVDCAQSTLCGAVGQTCATPFSANLTRTSGSFDASSPVMVVGAMGNPPAPTAADTFVAWTEVSSPSVTTFVRHWGGNGWDPPATYPAISRARAGGLALVLLNGKPVVAVSDTDSVTGQSIVVIHRWNGTAWVPTKLGAKVVGFDMVVDGNTLVLARTELGPYALVVSRFDSTSSTWSEIGRMDSPTQAISAPVVAVHSPDVFVGWTGGSAFHVRKLPSTDFPPVPYTNTTGQPSGLSLITDDTGNPVLGWINYSGNAIEGVHVSRFQGTQWNPLGGSVKPLLGGREYQLIASGSTFAIGGLHGEVFEWNENAASWGSVCSRLPPTVSGITGVALAALGNGHYLVAGVDAAAGTIFVEKNPDP